MTVLVAEQGSVDAFGLAFNPKGYQGKECVRVSCGPQDCRGRVQGGKNSFLERSHKRAPREEMHLPASIKP